MSGCKEKTITEQFRENCIKDINNSRLTKAQNEMAKLVLGWSYIVDDRRDVRKGIMLIKDAAESGNARAQADLGKFYSEGDYLEKDSAKALEWYQKAAAQGNQDAKKCSSKHATLSIFELILIKSEYSYISVKMGKLSSGWCQLSAAAVSANSPLLRSPPLSRHDVALKTVWLWL
jgi:TPR repeat protein